MYWGSSGPMEVLQRAWVRWCVGAVGGEQATEDILGATTEMVTTVALLPYGLLAVTW